MTHDDDPPDLLAVAAVDAALDGLRAGRTDDPVLSLLRDLVQDVERDLPEVERPLVPLGQGSTVVALAVAVADGRGRRALRSGVVAAAAAGLLTVSGVAAASTLAPVGSPLRGLGDVVRAATGAVVGAVTPPQTAARPPEAPVPPAASATEPVPSRPAGAPPARRAVAPSVRPSPPGAGVAAAARSRAAAREVDRLLDDAASLLAAGRRDQAADRLDRAERALADVLAADEADLPARLAELRAQVQQAPAPRQGPKREAEPGGRERTPEKEDKARTGRAGQPSKDASAKPRA